MGKAARRAFLAPRCHRVPRLARAQHVVHGHRHARRVAARVTRARLLPALVAILKLNQVVRLTAVGLHVHCRRAHLLDPGCKVVRVEAQVVLCYHRNRNVGVDDAPPCARVRHG
eukprot:4679172-Prymnesium_polylepis.1